eukprot:CAMPEP_0197586482 /NCGR_PEP_ID=MMETSP1326-20131121/8441_1 /TAXON_ID=1155430 /ORGANISM="Genus nov. species nov., Strain RCC2288" /LENGTH=51 /DNA_ID=CAMNT_0043151117 /DNA_START=230 /DNA_END=385 /DNA_ORIENTATION=+
MGPAASVDAAYTASAAAAAHAGSFPLASAAAFSASAAAFPRCAGHESTAQC